MGDGVRSFWKTGVFVTCVAVICGAVVLWWGVHREKAIERTLAQTATLYRVRAEQGDAKAQFRLGYIYYQGKGVPQDYAEAVRWYRKAADQGDPNAQTDLGSMYYQGKGVPQDYAEAVRWYRKAADQGHAWAQDGVAFMYYQGKGVPQDHAEALRWYRKAVDQDYADAARRIFSAIETVLSQRQVRTGDLGGDATTTQMADAIISAMSWP